MNNNKGFTLAELLAIVVIIGVIAVISSINMTKQISSSDKEEKNVLTQNIENASKIYAAKYYAKELIGSEDVKFKLTDLENEGLIIFKSGQCAGKRNEDINFNASDPYLYITDDNCYNN